MLFKTFPKNISIHVQTVQPKLDYMLSRLYDSISVFHRDLVESND